MVRLEGDSGLSYRLDDVSGCLLQGGLDDHFGASCDLRKVLLYRIGIAWMQQAMVDSLADEGCRLGCMIPQPWCCEAVLAHTPGKHSAGLRADQHAVAGCSTGLTNTPDSTAHCQD